MKRIVLYIVCTPFLIVCVLFDIVKLPLSIVIIACSFLIGWLQGDSSKPYFWETERETAVEVIFLGILLFVEASGLRE